MPMPKPNRLGDGIQGLAQLQAGASGQQLGGELDALGHPAALLTRMVVEQVVQHVELKRLGGVVERQGVGQGRRHGSSNAGDVGTVRSPSAR